MPDERTRPGTPGGRLPDTTRRGPVPSGTPESSDAGPPWPVNPDGPPGLRDHERPGPPDWKPIRKPRKPEGDPSPLEKEEPGTIAEIDPTIADGTGQ